MASLVLQAQRETRDPLASRVWSERRARRDPQDLRDLRESWVPKVDMDLKVSSKQLGHLVLNILLRGSNGLYSDYARKTI
mmetsp:Transcript_4835/g.7756  ORF Transcript_4835/g.7756 Transcript_4835/m.7756 type:complete len:80 (-) Transcript_4835:21-260(-)